MNSFSLFAKKQLVKIPSEFLTDKKGNPKKKLGSILVLSQPLSEKEKSLAVKIVASIGQNSQQELSFVELKVEESFDPLMYETLRLKFVLAFGIPAERTGLDIENEEYLWQNTESFKILLGDNLTAIGESRMLKQKLWSELKKIPSDV